MSENKNYFDDQCFTILNNFNWQGECFKNVYIKNEIIYMLDKTLRMFEYENLPETIPKFNLELLLQTHGFVAITKVNEKLYALFGGFGGVPNEYYMSTKIIVANPYLKFNKTLTINENCVLFKNDSMLNGLLPLGNKYASLLCENSISMRIATINNRLNKLISAGDDATKTSAEKYLKDVVDGKLGVIGDNAFIESLKLNETKSGYNEIKDLIEEHQYLKASWFNELGLNANYNMKRESLNSSEVALNDDILTPFVDDMLKCRQEAVEKINEMFGTEIKVKLSSAWKDNQKEIEIAQQEQSFINQDLEQTTETEVKNEIQED